MIVVRQDAVVGNKGERQTREYERPDEEHPREPGFIERAPREHHNPQSEEEPEWIAPHRDRAAAGDCRHGQNRREWPESQPVDDAAVENVGAEGDLIGASTRKKQRQSNQQRWNEEKRLADAELKWMPEVVNQAARGQRAVLGVGERQEIVLHQPDDMWRHCNERRTQPRCKDLALPELCVPRGRRG